MQSNNPNNQFPDEIDLRELLNFLINSHTTTKTVERPITSPAYPIVNALVRSNNNKDNTIENTK